MGEKLVFLKREEIRTMAKDLARLQEEEAIKEKEKISKLKLEEKLKKESSQREEIIKTMIPGETEIMETREDMAAEEISSRISKTPSWKKVLVRIMIILSFFVFLFLIGFAYWYFAVKRKQNLQPSPESSESPTLSVSVSASPSVSLQPAESVNPAIPPIPVISVKEIKIINLSQESNLREQLSKAVEEIIPTGNNPEFFEILLKKNDQFLGMKDLFEGLELKSPENLFSSVSDKIEDFDFFIYAKNGINQGFGLVVKTSVKTNVKAKEKESLLSLLNAWEQAMPSDLSNLFMAMNKQATLAGTVFKQANYADATFRYLSFKEPGLGIYWSVYNDYLIISSSGESIAKTIDGVMEKSKIAKPEESAPSIIERILNWGYYLPTATRTIDTIIVHSAYNAIGGDVYDVEKVIEEYRIYKVASHYLISRDGTIYRLSPNKAIAYHAGVGKMPDGSRVNIINNFSLGIEVIYTKTESPNEEQYQSLAQLVKYLKQQYNIPSENILGHNQIAPERKDDPWNFDWEKFIQMLK